MVIRALIAVMAACLFAGCASADRNLFPPRAGEPRADIVVFDNHWHTGVILPFADLPPAMRTQLAAFAEYPYIAIGWGDTDFFRSAHVTPGLVVRAMFFSHGTVLLVVGLAYEPEEAYADSVDVYRIHAGPAGFEKMVDAISASFVQASGSLVDRGVGQEGFSRFFQGTGRYSALRTCNVWTANMLRAAGLPITPAFALSAGNIEYQLGKIPGTLRNGQLIPQRKPKPVPIPHGSRLILSPGTPGEG